MQSVRDHDFPEDEGDAVVSHLHRLNLICHKEIIQYVELSEKLLLFGPYLFD